MPAPSAKYQLTGAEAETSKHTTESAYQRKPARESRQAKYGDMCDQIGFNFFPISYESSGKVHSLM